MRRALALIGVALLPGSLVLGGLVLLVAAFARIHRDREDTLTAETMRGIHRACALSALEEVEPLPRGVRTVLDGPTSDYSRPWTSRR